MILEINCCILYRPAQYHPSSDLSTHDQMPGDDFQLLKWPLKESPETLVPLPHPVQEGLLPFAGCDGVLLGLDTTQEGDLSQSPAAG